MKTSHSSLILSIFFSIFLLCRSDVTAQMTAYDALRVVGSQRGQQFYNQLISIAGRSATPQPAQWALLFHDPSSPTGLREMIVAGGAIVADRTPSDPKTARKGASAAINIKSLNLNSDGAFKIVELEARNEKIGFDSVNYFLKGHEVTRQPVWLVELLNARRQRIATAMVSAETGRTLRPPSRGSQHTIPGRPGATQQPPTAQGPPGQSPTGRGSDRLVDRVSRTMDKTAKSIEDQLVGFGEFLTGKRGDRR